MNSNHQLLIDLSEQWALSQRKRIPERFEALSKEDQWELGLQLLHSTYRDVRDYIVEIAVEFTWHEDVRWIEKLKEVASAENCEVASLYMQHLLRLIINLPQEHLKAFVEVLWKSVRCEDGNVRYFGLIGLEKSEIDTEDYREMLVALIKDKDVDMRIVASQGVVRLQMKEVLPDLVEATQYTCSEERMHLLLARQALGDTELEPHFCDALSNDATAYAAILALEKCGTQYAIDPLALVWKSPFTEPTIRVAAARCAAQLGSKEAKAMLEKLAKRKGGNPILAQEALESLQGKN